MPRTIEERVIVINGVEWAVYPLTRTRVKMAADMPRTRPGTVVFRSKGGALGRGELPEGHALQDVTDEELADVVNRARTR